MKKNIDLYKKETEKFLAFLEEEIKKSGVEKEAFVSSRRALEKTSVSVTSKWLSGRKYCRTFFLQKAFGSLYPSSYTAISLSLDALVNISDDIFDEPLEKKEINLYMAECLKLLSLLNSYPQISKIQPELGVYFSKLLSLVAAENFYQEKISQGRDYKQMVEDSSKLLLIRAQDIDIFTEIALLDFKTEKDLDSIREIAKIFRALNIFKKDIKDLDYDRSHNIKTVVITLKDKEINLKDYSQDLISGLEDKMKKVVCPQDQGLKLPFRAFQKMIEEEEGEIFKILD